MADRYQLASEFEETLMSHRIQSLTDPAELKEIALQLMRLNFGLKAQFKQMAKLGWINEQF